MVYTFLSIRQSCLNFGVYTLYMWSCMLPRPLRRLDELLKKPTSAVLPIHVLEKIKVLLHVLLETGIHVKQNRKKNRMECPIPFNGQSTPVC